MPSITTAIKSEGGKYTIEIFQGHLCQQANLGYNTEKLRVVNKED